MAAEVGSLKYGHVPPEKTWEGLILTTQSCTTLHACHTLRPMWLSQQSRKAVFSFVGVSDVKCEVRGLEGGWDIQEAQKTLREEWQI